MGDINFDHQPALNRDMVAHLGTGAFLGKARNVVLLGPPGTGSPRTSTHCSMRPTEPWRRSRATT
ncbi:ATP-binding protein [Mycobacterium avium]|uniref:ATP-binding protein n=1 Tax=Mycobacterium avium TaxID=1764 RepID=UPI001CC375CB|nr:ATP-binding protein [Mycobacterium avium]